MQWLSTWLVETTWQAALLVVVIALVQLAFGRWMSPRARYAMWMIVAVRLALPVLPESGWSLYRWTGHANGGVPVAHAPRVSSVIANSEGGPHTGGVGHFAVSATVLLAAGVMPDDGVLHASAKSEPGDVASVDWMIVGLWVWAGGGLLMLLRLAVQSVRATRLRHKARPLTADELGLTGNLCQQLGRVRVRESDGIASPALCGLIRPTILLPAGLAARLDKDQLEQVIRHELAHVARRDHWTNAAMRFLQAIHWFNPAIWFTFSRCKLERELACDEAVLRQAESGPRELYGRTLLAIATQLGGANREPMLTMAEGKRHLRRRIHSIAAGPKRGRSGVLAVVLCVVLTLTGLTAAQAIPGRQQAVVLEAHPVALAATVPSEIAHPRAIDLPASATAPQQATPIEPGRERAPSGAAEKMPNPPKPARPDPERKVESETIPPSAVTCAYGYADVLAQAVPQGVPLTSVASGQRIGPTANEVLEQTADLIRDTIDPESWRDKGGSIGLIQVDPKQQRLIVTQTPECQAKIKELLQSLRSGYDAQITVEVRLVTFSGDKLAKEDRDWVDKLRQTSGAVLSDSDVARLIQLCQQDTGSAIVTSPRVTVFSGGSANVSVTTQTPYVAGLKPDATRNRYELVLAATDTGTTLEVRAAASQDRKSVVLSVSPKIARLTAMDTFTYVTKAPESVTVQQPRTSEWGMTTQAIVPNGRTAIVGISQVRGTQEVVEPGREFPKAPKANMGDRPAVRRMTSVTGDLLVLVKPVIVGPAPARRTDDRQ